MAGNNADGDDNDIIVITMMTVTTTMTIQVTEGILFCKCVVNE